MIEYFSVLGFLDAGEIAVFIPITALMIPIVAILVKHQQRMAEIMHGSGGAQTHAEVAQLRNEVYELKQMLHQQMITVDSMLSTPKVNSDQPLQQRLEQIQ